MTVSRWSANGGEFGGRERTCVLVWRMTREFGFLGVEVVEAGLEAREPVFAAFG